MERESRKVVTVLFCDLVGSTTLGESTDPEALRARMRRYFEDLRAIIERHGGTVEKFVGDAVMAVFGIPVSHEDDALRAVRAALEMREAVAAHGLEARIGVNSGEVVVGGHDETLVTGDAVNVAARLEQAAAAGEVLIGSETRQLVRDAVVVEPVEPLALKGKSQPVEAFRLVDVLVGAESVARHLERPLVGRERERQRLRRDFEDAAADGSCRLFTLLGPAGIGKSRLVADFLEHAGQEADILRGRCLPYGEGITYWPLVEILIAAGVDPETILGTSAAETQLTFRRLLEERAAERPQVVVLDDLQWAEPTFLDLVEHVADLSRDAPIFLLCVAAEVALVDQHNLEAGPCRLVRDAAPDDAASDDEEVGDLTLELLECGRPPLDGVGGITAIFEDFGDAISEKLPLFIGVVVLLSALLLMIVFRSVLVPLKAMVMNLLSIGAAFGLIVAVFQWGWGASIIGIDGTGPIISFFPVFLFAIVFGLSMDYEVFLMSRIHEEWEHKGDATLAVTRGLALTGRVITAAAAIMVTVFASFMIGEDRIIKLFGLGLSSAVFIDAVIIRSVLVPAVMQLFGRRAWWLPAWLDRILPRLHVEPAEGDPSPTGEHPVVESA